MRTETYLVLGLKTFTFKYSVSFSTTLPLTVMGNSDDILLYFDIRHYDMNMPYTCLMSHISIADQWLLSNTKWKSFRIQCILMKDIMWSLPANVLKTFWNTSLHFNISFCHAAFFLRHHWGEETHHPSLSPKTHSQPSCSVRLQSLLLRQTTQKLCSSSPTNVYIHSSHSLSFSFCLAPGNRRGKQLWFPWAHRTGKAHSNCCNFPWSHYQNLSPGCNIYEE